MILKIYDTLLKTYGYQDWWPVSTTADPFLEISLGAILTQNTNWKNVEKALQNLQTKKVLNWKTLQKINISILQELIKPAGFYKRKSTTIKNFVKTINPQKKENITRQTLLNIKGIGKETADSILLYGLEKPIFVVDTYTKRLFSRLGLTKKDIKYDELQKLIQDKIPKNTHIYQEYHALIVKHAKEHCKKKPICTKCPLESLCNKNVII
ncbi:MAG: endonuclease [Aquificae bacterium]|nr:endonuclease [Aquificota bacterium]